MTRSVEPARSAPPQSGSGRGEHAARLALGGHGPHATRGRARGLPRLIASDLDGTLIGAGYVISRRTAAVLRRATAAGTTVVLVTGRPIRWMSMVYEQLGAEYPTVCANGAVVYDPVADVVRDSWQLYPDLLREVCARLRARVPDVRFSVEVEGGRRLLYESGVLPFGETPRCAAVADFDELLVRPAVKLLASCDGRGGGELTGVVTGSVGDLVEATYSSNDGVVEMSCLGVDKGTGLARVAAEYGIAAEDVLAFGDMPNDLPMLTWAGRSVAMANAHPLVRAAAGELTLSNVEDGVAAYVERLLPA